MIDLKVGYECNNDCVFCAVKSHNQDNRTFDEYNTIMTEERKNSDCITITGGEVTIRNDFFKILDRARELNYSIYIQSNGRYFSTPITAYCMRRYDIAGFLISIHGHNPEIHEALTNVKGSFEETVTGIENLVDECQNVTTNTVLMNKNIGNMKDLCVMFASLGVSNILLSYPDITGGALNNISEVPPLYKVMDEVPRIVDVCEKLGMTVMFDNIPMCVMLDYSNYCNPKTPVKLMLLDLTLDNFTPNTIIDECKGCKVVEYCCHPQEEYIKHFGKEEFEAIT